MRMKRNSALVLSLARLAARVVVSASLGLSFFASLVPLGASASSGMPAMACCVGKAGHCSSGLMTKRRARPKPEQMCGLKLPAQGEEPTGDDTTSDESATDPDINDEITVVAASPEAETDLRSTGSQSTELFTGTQGSRSTSSRRSTVPADSTFFTKPCSVDCCADTTAVLRQPRSREIALLANGNRGFLPRSANGKTHLLTPDFSSSATLKHPGPRGPPCSSC